MKKFTKDQIIFFAVSGIAILLLIYKTVDFGLITGLGAQSIKYQSSVDSIITLESTLGTIQKGELQNRRDLFNFKIAHKVIVQQPVVPIEGTAKPVVKKSYNYELTIEPVSDLELLVTAVGKARINVGGAARQVVVGDQVNCANGVEVEVDAETGEKTGKTRPAGVKSGVVASIDKRNVYFRIPGSSQGIKLNARDGAKLIDADLIPKGANSGGTEESGAAAPENTGGTKVKRQR